MTHVFLHMYCAVVQHQRIVVITPTPQAAAPVQTQLVAGSLPVNGWQITIAGYVILTTFGTIFIGFAAVFNPMLSLMYRREANALQVCVRAARTTNKPVPQNTTKQLDLLISETSAPAV